MEFSVNLIGVGNMGSAMLKGWCQAGLRAENIVAIDPAPGEAAVKALTELGVRHVQRANEASPADVLVIAVKPQMMSAVLPTLTPLMGDETVAVSVAAGTTIATLSKELGDAAITRVMPNTPSLVGRGMSAGFANPKVSKVQRGYVAALMQGVGLFEWVDQEAMIDTVTAVSGSGPAYVFHLAECMAAAGVNAGLPEELAMKLARQTVSGAGELLYRSSDTPGTLRKNVTSPGGTTAAALSVLMQDDAMKHLLNDAIEAAKNRSEELSERS